MSGLGAGRVNARRRQLSRSLGPSRTLHTIWLLRRYPPNSGQMAKSEGARSQPSLSPEPVGFGWKSVRATPPRLAYTHAETAVGEQMALFKSSNPEKTCSSCATWPMCPLSSMQLQRVSLSSRRVPFRCSGRLGRSTTSSLLVALRCLRLSIWSQRCFAPMRMT
jgi:hypothetical protein